MATLPGLNLRGGVYQLRTTIPTDLRARFGRACIRKSLNTSDRSEAELLGTVERARLLALFAAAKKTQGTLPTLSAAVQKVLEPLEGIALPMHPGIGTAETSQPGTTAKPQATSLNEPDFPR